MEPSVALISAADSGYYAMLDGLLASLEAANLPPHFHLCTFDLGLTADQVVSVRQRVKRLIVPDWALDFPGREQAPPWFRAMVNRPFLPRYFPGFDVYLWIDVDAWVQDGRCLAEFVAAAEDGALAIVPERFGPPIKYVTPLPDGRYRVQEISETLIRRNLAQCYRDCFGPEYEVFGYKEVRNSGVFALRGDSPAWAVWQDYLKRGLRAGVKHVLVEQAALNVAYLDGKIACRDLPFRCNWNISTNHPLLDETRGVLVDPADRDVIGMVHLNDAKQYPGARLKTTKGGVTNVPFGYRAFGGVKLGS